MGRGKKPQKEFPECFKIIDGATDEDDVISISLFAYKEFMQSIGKGTALSISKMSKGVQRKYREHFLDLCLNLCNIIQSNKPKIKLLHYEFIKICMDYFRALQANYEGRGLSGFKTGQLNSVFATEVFGEYCIDEYGSIKNYLDDWMKVKKKFMDTTKVFRPKAIPKRRIHFHQKQSTVIEKPTGVEGLFELVII